MSWPTPQDYNEAIQNPRNCFADSDLQHGSPELFPPPLSTPKPNTGSYASVYRMQCGTRDWAVRCFIKEVGDLQERYQAISQYLRTVKMPYTVEFYYLPNGIRVAGKWYPILKMEWVRGEALLTYIQRHSRDAVALQNLATRWVEMIKALKAASVAHGDLQHGNIFIAKDDFKLVDYDGMYVPILAGRKSNENGQRNYQHPKRTKDDFGPYLDNFSAWTIYTALIALSLDAGLRARVNEGDDWLLFHDTDFSQPTSSVTLASLERHNNPNVRSIARLFRDILNFDPQQVPSLDGQILPLSQSISQASVTSTDWIKDYVGGSRNPPSANTSSSNNTSPIKHGASWVIDFIDPSTRLNIHKFGKSMRVPRISLALSVMALVISAGFLLSLSVISTSLLTLTFLSTGVLGLFNLFILDWHYMHDPAVREIKTLRAREKHEHGTIAKLEIAAINYEKRKASLQIEEDRQQSNLEMALKRIKDQEQRQIDRIQFELKQTLDAIQMRRTAATRDEKNALLNLKSTLGSKFDSLTYRIIDLNQAETKEISNELQAIQVRFVEDYLKGHPIEEAPLTKINWVSRSTLANDLILHGITTANDVTYRRVDAVYGFGPKRTQLLVNWRNSLEQQAKQNMPKALSAAQVNSIQIKYAMQRRNLEIERDSARNQLANEENTINDRFNAVRQALDKNESDARTESKQKTEEVVQQFAKLLAGPSQEAMQVARDFDNKRSKLEDQLTEIRRQVFSHDWELEKCRHELRGYKNISFRKYIKAVFFW